jgi:DNA relaxase NicK
MLVSENKTVHFGSKPNKDFTIYSKEGKEIAEQKKRHIFPDILN